ncbi:Hypothetical protein TPAR_09195 [Tolypocladium paradoxum]|uniref:Uncharacterized protein n=1 Tax=Tolypocladium paradoxum TaxID=94208 RepID=A0A2S4L085_9HYPO|nr:Hypothetical protein TPAR_09195 [Tolypocladium paradoxum]
MREMQVGRGGVEDVAEAKGRGRADPARSHLGSAVDEVMLVRGGQAGVTVTKVGPGGGGVEGQPQSTGTNRRLQATAVGKPLEQPELSVKASAGGAKVVEKLAYGLEVRDDAKAAPSTVASSIPEKMKSENYPGVDGDDPSDDSATRTSIATSFHSAVECKSHLDTAHLGQISAYQADALIKLNAQPTSTPDRLCCPFCGESQSSLMIYQRHVGRHEEQLSLFALPFLEVDDDMESESRANYYEGRSLAPNDDESDKDEWESQGSSEGAYKRADSIETAPPRRPDVSTDTGESTERGAVMDPQNARDSTRTDEYEGELPSTPPSNVESVTIQWPGGPNGQIKLQKPAEKD